MIPSFSLRGKAALVTGGTRGMGRVMALTLAAAGADVAVSSRHLGEAEQTTQEIRNLERRAVAIEADIRRAPDILRMINTVESELGPLDILINNAGVNVRKGLLETSEVEWDFVHDKKLKGYFCARKLRRRP